MKAALVLAVLTSGCAGVRPRTAIDDGILRAIDRVLVEEETTLLVRFGVDGCFGASRAELRLRHSSGGFSFDGLADPGTPVAERAPITFVDPSVASEFVSSLRGALAQPERPSRVRSFGDDAWARVTAGAVTLVVPVAMAAAAEKVARAQYERLPDRRPVLRPTSTRIARATWADVTQ